MPIPGDFTQVDDFGQIAPIVDPHHEYERRKRAWLVDNPGAWAMEVRDACARFAEELGI